MTPFWMLPESCRTLPGGNLVQRLQVAIALIRLLRNPISEAPSTDSRTPWTAWIKKTLYEVMGEKQFVISPEGYSSTRGEFLRIDVTVEEREVPKRIVLAVESEIDNTKSRYKAIEHDFEKLLAVKSPFKLMIYSSEKQGFTNGKAVDVLRRNLEPYGHHLKGETYIFVDYFEHSRKNGSFIAHAWQSESNGMQKPVRISPVS